MTLSEVCKNLDRVGALGVARRIARKYGVSLAEMLGDDSHHRTASAARHELWTVMRHTLDLSYEEVGDVVGRHHSTVMTGVRKCERALEEQYPREAAS